MFVKSIESRNEILSHQVQRRPGDKNVPDADNFRIRLHAGNNLLSKPAGAGHSFGDAETSGPASGHPGAQHAGSQLFGARPEEVRVAGHVLHSSGWSTL